LVNPENLSPSNLTVKFSCFHKGERFIDKGEQVSLRSIEC